MQVIIGADPHKSSNTELAISDREDERGSKRERATKNQDEQSLAQAAAFPPRGGPVERADERGVRVG